MRRIRKTVGRALLTGALVLTMLTTMVPLAPLTASAATDTGAKLIAFTFDDGPSVNTTTLLDGLKSRGVVATFFMCASNGSHGINNHGALLDRMVREGHQLANHSYDHPSIGSLSGSQVASTFSRVEKLLFQHMGGSYIDMVRTPGGAYNNTIKNNTAAPIILWSVDTLDWKYRNADSVYNKIMSGSRDGSIVLMHDLYKTSVQGALRAVDSLKKQGYEFVTVSELMRRRGVTPQNGSKYTNFPNNGTNLPAYSAPVITSAENDGLQQTVVTMSSDNAGLALHYTTDGSYPTLASPLYSGPFGVNEDTSFRVVGYDAYGTRTPEAYGSAKKYSVAVPTAVSNDGLVTLQCATPGAELYYTLDGSDPKVSGTRYTAPFKPDGKKLTVMANKGGAWSRAVSTYAVMDNGVIFEDVDADAWYYPVVNKAVVSEYMRGTGDQTFEPDSHLSRAMMVQILYNMEGRPAADSVNVPSFEDVPDGQWFAGAVRWAASEGIVQGYSETVFAPDDDVTREQMVTILYRYAKNYKKVEMNADKDLSGFRDSAEVSDYAVDAFRWSVSNSIVEGDDTLALMPKNPAARAAAAAVIVRFSDHEWTPAKEAAIVKEISDIDKDLTVLMPLSLDSVRLLDNGELIAKTNGDLKNSIGEEVKIADNVKDVYLLPFGNGGFRSLLFIREDGTVSAVNASELIANRKIEILDNLGGYQNVASVEEFSDEDGHGIEAVLAGDERHMLDEYLK